MILALLACTDDGYVPLHFDGPIAAAVLPEGAGGPFETPVGFVANSRSGTIIPLDLKEERLLNDDTHGSFLRAGAIPTGGARQLVDVGVHAVDGVVTLWSIDANNDVVVRAPYITGADADGAPEEVEPSVGEATFVDADSSGDDATMTDIAVHSGFTTTETWSIESDGVGWWAFGSRSGAQSEQPEAGTAYTTDGGELTFTVSGTATVGDRFEISTDSGITELATGGVPTRLKVVDDRVYVTALSEPPAVIVIDATTATEIGRVALPEGASPWSMDFSADGRLFVGDAAAPTVHVLRFDLELDPAAVALEAIPTVAPVQDLAVQEGEDIDGDWFERMFVAPVALGRVDVYDLRASAWVDPNPITPEVEGVPLGAPIQALARSVDDVWLQQETDFGALPRVPTVVVTTQDGYTLQLDASTGCYVVDAQGPHGPYTTEDLDASYAWVELEDVGATSDTWLYIDVISSIYGDQVVTSECGGVTRSETWTLLYDASRAAWTVEGTVSGLQAGLATEGTRYVSDTGAISFVILAGARPTSNGDSFTFVTDRGLASVLGTDRDDSGEIDSGDHVWEFPARPVGFNYTTGPSGGGWDEVDRREFALVPTLNSDLVGKLQLDKAKATFDWE